MLTRKMLLLCGLVVGVPMAEGQEKTRPEILTVSPANVSSLAVSPDGKWLASGSYSPAPSNDLKTWDWATGTLKATLSGHSHHIHGVAFSPDGKLLASVSLDKTARLWDVATGKEKATIVRGPTSLRTVRFSTDGKTLGVAGTEWLRLCDVATGKEKIAFKIPVGSICFHPTLELLALSPDATYIHLIDTATTKTRTLLTGHKGPVHAMTFSDDGKWLATYSIDHMLCVWDVAAGKQKESFSAQAGGKSVAFDRAGKTVALGLVLGKVRLWDLNSGKELSMLHDAKLGTVHSVVFSADGKSLAAGGEGQIRFWDVPAQ